MSKITNEAPVNEEVWPLPEEAAVLLQGVDRDCSELLLRLGSLEADYAATKNDLLLKLRAKRELFNNLLTETAKKGGLNVESERWVLNHKEMALVRKS